MKLEEVTNLRTAFKSNLNETSREDINQQNNK